MASEVEICNLALSHIRGRSINSLTEASREAQQCKLKYPILRDVVLESTPWQFATSLIALALRAEDPLEWIYSYQNPSDALNIQYITADFGFRSQDAEGLAFRNRNQIEFVEPDTQVPYEMGLFDGNSVILTDQRDAYAKFTAKVTDPNLFSNLFKNALSRYLAAELALPIVGGDLGRALMAENLEIYASLIDSAVAKDGNAQKRAKRNNNDMINAITS